jgi:hypothetical protein
MAINCTRGGDAPWRQSVSSFVNKTRLCRIWEQSVPGRVTIETTIAENINFLFLLQSGLITFFVDLNTRVGNAVRLSYNTNHSRTIKKKKMRELIIRRRKKFNCRRNLTHTATSVADCLNQRYSTSFVRVLLKSFLLKLAPPLQKWLVYNSSYTQSIIYI